jgi:hypothetical protein
MNSSVFWVIMRRKLATEEFSSTAEKANDLGLILYFFLFLDASEII